MSLTPSQQNAFDLFKKFILTNKINSNSIVIEGFPGTGKSFLIKSLLDFADNYNNLNKLVLKKLFDDIEIVCTATTNKACKVLSDFIKKEVITIHSYLGLSVTNNLSTGTTSIKKNKNFSFKKNKIIIIDEYSFIDYKLLKYIEESCINSKIIYVGDSYQLTPVKSGISPVNNTIKTKAVLSDYVRYKDNSYIAVLAKSFRETIDTNIFQNISFNSNCSKHIINDKEYLNLVDKHFIKNETNSKILCWSNKRVHEYNGYIHKKITGSDKLIVGDTVVSNKHYKGIKCDTVVEIQSITPDSFEGVLGNWIGFKNYDIQLFQPNDHKEVITRLKNIAKDIKNNTSILTHDWLYYFYIKDSIADIRPIFSSTVHKSQGSTYDTTFIDLDDIGRCNDSSTVARLLHVAVSRTKKNIIFYGNLPDKYRGL